MAVAFDAVGPSAAGAVSTGSTTLSWTHTAVASGVALLVSVALGVVSGGDGPFDYTVTCDGTAMTLVQDKVHGNASTFGFIKVYWAAGISSGAHTITATATGGTPTGMAGGSLSFTGAAGFGRPVTGTGTSATGSVSIASTPGNMIAGFIGDGNGTTSATGPATSRFINNGGIGSCIDHSAGATSPSTGSPVTMAWTITSDFWAVIAVEVQQALQGSRNSQALRAQRPRMAGNYAGYSQGPPGFVLQRPVPPPNPLTPVQITPLVHGTTINSGTITLTFGGAVTPGNTVVVLFGSGQTTLNPQVSGITLGGNPDRFAVQEVLNSGVHLDAEIWSDPGVTVSGATSVAVSYAGGTGAAADVFAVAYEVPGVLTLDKGITATNATGTTFSSGATGTTTRPNEIFFGSNAGGASGVATGSGTWTTVVNAGGAICGYIGGYQIVSATGTCTFSGTQASNSSTTVAATFYQSSAGQTVSNTSFASGRISWNAGAPVSNPISGPVFRQARQVIRVRLPRGPYILGNPGLVFNGIARGGQASFGSGRVVWNQGAPVKNPTAGPVFRQATSPRAAKLPVSPLGSRAPRGRIIAQRGAPVKNATTGPVFHQATSPCRAKLPVTPIGARAFKGRIVSNPGAPVRNPASSSHGQPAGVRVLYQRIGSVLSNRGALVVNPTRGPPFKQAAQPIQARIPANGPRGRVSRSALAAVPLVLAGPPLTALDGPVRAKRQPLPGLTYASDIITGTISGGGGGALSGSQLAAFTQGAALTAVSPSVSPAANSVVFVSITFQGASLPAITGVSGLGLSWAAAVTQSAYDSSFSTAAIWWAATGGSAPTPGTITVSFNVSSTFNGVVDQVANGIALRGGASSVGTHGSGTTAAAPSSPAPLSSASFLYGAVADAGGQAFTANGALTNIGSSTGANEGLETQGATGITTSGVKCSATFSPTDFWAAMCVEVTGGSAPVAAQGTGYYFTGRIGANYGAKVQNPGKGPFFEQASQPSRARIPQNGPRGRIGSNKGFIPTGPTSGPFFEQATTPARARIPGTFSKGRVSSSPGAPVRNPGKGPVFEQAVTPAQARIPQTFSKGRVYRNAGAPVRNPGIGPFFEQATTPASARIPQVFSKGRVYRNAGAPVNNPGKGPVFEQAATPAQARIPQVFSKGRVYRNAGAPVQNPGKGPVFEQATQPVQVRIPQTFSKGRVSFNAGAPVRNPGTGPRFIPRPYPVQVADPLPRRGRVYSNPGGPVPVPTVTGPVFEQAATPSRIRPGLPPRGRVYSSPGAPVRNPVAGPRFLQFTHPVQARFPLPPRGRTGSNPGGPVASGIGPVFYPKQPARAKIPQNGPRGRVYSNRGAPVNNPRSGPVFRQFTHPVSVRYPRLQPAAGRIDFNPGALVRNPQPGPVVYALDGPVRVRLPQLHPRAGRVLSNKGAPVKNPVTGPVFRQFTHPVQARFPLPRRGRVTANRGGPVSNPALHTWSGSFNIILPGGCFEYGAFGITLPPLKVSLRGYAGRFGPLSVALPSLVTSLAGNRVPLWPGVRLPVLRVTLTGKVTYGRLKIALPPPVTAITGSRIRHITGNFNLVFTCVPDPTSVFSIRLPVPVIKLALSPVKCYTANPDTAWETSLPWKGWNVSSQSSVSISHLSTQYVFIPVKATKNGVVFDPTTDPVQFAFMPTPTQVPGVSDWASGSWITDTTNVLYPHSARILVGPGGSVNPGIGNYVIYVKISDSPETPVLIVGYLEIT